ncbi:hypothetical protein QQ73_13655 [Candidatus Endoriftia persephone str. Guaymas]|nr:hypothetical protein [Candidatus Endoriftia persephone str. Guaymas]
MAFHGGKIITVEQPVDLLAIQGHHLVSQGRPMEPLLGQALAVEHEAIVFPVQQLDNFFFLLLCFL